MSSCDVCQSVLGCAVNCSNAPWNWDLPRTNRFGYLRRLVRWIRECHGSNEKLSYFPHLTWLPHRMILAARVG